MRLLLQIVSNALAIYVASYLVPGFDFKGNLTILLITGLILGIINFFLKPILKFFLTPLIIISLGLFSIIINMAILALIDYLVPDLVIANLYALFLGTIVISIVNLFLGLALKKK